MKKENIAVKPIVIIIFILLLVFSIRLDFGSGIHTIQPTAIDNDIFGNYKVYFKTSEYTLNSQEDYYYIEKGRKDLSEQIVQAIKDKKTITVYYDKYIGFKGITAPSDAPITKIETN